MADASVTAQDAVNEKHDFYVYILYRPNGIPCYVGKGRRRRWMLHEAYVKRGEKRVNPHLANIIRNAGGNLPKARTPPILTEKEAFELEMFLIAEIGREEHGGPLVNLTDGGEGPSGVRVSEERKRRARAAMLGNTWGLGFKQSPEQIAARIQFITGRKRTPEVRAKMSEAQRGNTKFLGKTHSKETKEKMSKAAIARAARGISDETREKMSAVQRGRPGTFLGKKHSEESKRKMSASRIGLPGFFKGRTHSDETRARMSAAKLGKPSGRAGKSSPMKGRKHTEESKEKIRRAANARKVSPDAGKRISAGKRGKPWSAAQRASFESRKSQVKTGESIVEVSSAGIRENNQSGRL